jgi:hypothetical protein
MWDCMIQSPKKIIKIKPERLFIYQTHNIILIVKSYNVLHRRELCGCKDFTDMLARMHR